MRSTSLAVAIVALTPSEARAQACCAAASAVTPARLGFGEQALVGMELRSQGVFGSYGVDGRFIPTPAHSSETDLTASLLVAARVSKRVQIAGVVPWQETRRVSPGLGELGGGVGDTNLSVRYDAQFEYERLPLPGVAFLVGTTIPTGRAPELARRPLATDATGIGAVQLHAALALERRFGHWLVGATGLVAQRLPRSVGSVETTLGTQLTGLATLTYTLSSIGAVAASASYSTEGDATVDGRLVSGTGRRSLQLALSGVAPLADSVRLQGSVFASPPLDGFGRNQNAVTGASVSALFAF